MQIAKEEEEKRKSESKKHINAITDEIDLDLEKSKLLNQLKALDGALATNIEEDQNKAE